MLTGAGAQTTAVDDADIVETAEELDAEMADYFGGAGNEANMTNGGAVQPAAGGDVGMEEDTVA